MGVVIGCPMRTDDDEPGASACDSAGPMAQMAAGAAMGLLLRDATPADIPALMAIEQVCFDSPVAFNRRRIRNLITNPRVYTSVAVVDGSVAGWAVGLVRRHHSHRSGRLYNLAIATAARGRGVGRRLVEHLLACFSRAGVRHIYLEVEAGNAAAIALYERCGFTQVRTLNDYFGSGRPGISMRRSVT